MRIQGLAAGLLAAGLLAACSQEAAPGAEAPPAAGQAEMAGVEAACRDNLLTRIPHPEVAKIEAISPVEWREYAAGLKTSVFVRLSGQTLGQMEKVASQAMTGGEASTGKTWRIKLKARTIEGRDVTVPAWCRSLKTAPDGCACETQLRTE